jgi:hypothetical protein
LPIAVSVFGFPYAVANSQYGLPSGIFIREASSRIYSPYVFALAQLLCEIPYTLVCGAIYWALMVYPQGFGQGSAGLGGTVFQLIPVLMMVMFGVTFGQLLSAISPSVQVAVLFNPFVSLIFGTFSGVSIPYNSLIPFWRWIYQVIPHTRYLGAMITTELVYAFCFLDLVPELTVSKVVFPYAVNLMSLPPSYPLLVKLAHNGQATLSNNLEGICKILTRQICASTANIKKEKISTHR